VIYRLGDSIRVPALAIVVTLLRQADADEINRVGIDQWIDQRLAMAGRSTVAILH
jgi:hypothetical protein